MLLHERSNVFDLSQSHFGFRITISKEAAVHVFSLSIASVVASYDSVRIDHGQEPELKVLAQFMRQYIARKQEVYHAMNDEARMRLA